MPSNPLVIICSSGYDTMISASKSRRNSIVPWLLSIIVYGLVAMAKHPYVLFERDLDSRQQTLILKLSCLALVCSLPAAEVDEIVSGSGESPTQFARYPTASHCGYRGGSYFRCWR
ncbi:hypothetical protein BDDG_12235 [Blastomyces dermatitidis ATCC 18188]|uniref:Uncharacterized protein n=2 Tax=Ajellomyces dermatitidis TaxID=5039 RepID=A0A0J9ER64_AJEDA|nr:hypothetical protein BDDG_12235 [Blastomyces dermatitidis ATCC 18188]